MTKHFIALLLSACLAGCATSRPHDELDTAEYSELQGIIHHLRQNNPDLFMRWVQRLTDGEWRSGERHPLSDEFEAFLETYAKEHNIAKKDGQQISAPYK